jgi:predicted secreted Zn-dependent protease
MSRTIAVASLSLVLSLLAMAGPVRADSFRVESFDIHGNTARQLRDDLTRRGPVGETGIPGDAYTEYRIAWKFSMRMNDGVCRVDNVVVDLDVTMQLPRWVPPAGTSPQLVDTWKRFSRDLRAHEDGHYRLAMAAAEEVRRKLQARIRAPSCDRLKAKLNDRANDVLREYRERQHRYDLDTDYGRARGTPLL